MNPTIDSTAQKKVKIAEKEGSLILSASRDKEILKAIKKHEKDPKQKSKIRLQALIMEKRDALEKMGIPSDPIKEATSKVEFFINKNDELTDKKLMILFFAALYINQKATEKDKNSQNPNLNERAMQEVSGIDRKTIRKWKKVFEDKPQK